MTYSPGGVPVNWAELVAIHKPLIKEYLERDKKLLRDVETDGEPPEKAFSGTTRNLALVTVMAGPRRAKPLLELMTGFAAKAIPSMDPLVESDLISPMQLIFYVNLARSCAVTLPPEGDGLESRWLPRLAGQKRELSEKERMSLALAAAANALPELVPKFIGGGKLPKRIKPGEIFDFNAFGFIRYIAAAIACEADANDVLPAWRNFVACFPYKLAADTLAWIDLTLSAEAFIVQLQKQPVGTVASELHRVVMELAKTS